MSSPNFDSPVGLPQVLCWFSRAVPKDCGHMQVSNLQQLAGLFPQWPTSYLLLITRNEPEVLSITLVDFFGQTIQMNLFSLAGFGMPKAVLLGGSSRIDPKFSGYSAKPSDFSKHWILRGVIPWLASRGNEKLYLRAHFEGANSFFGDIGFVDAPEIGKPYMARALYSDDNILEPVAFESIPVVSAEGSELEAALLVEQEKTMAAALAYFEQIRAVGKEEELIVHQQLSDEFSGRSLAEFEKQWSLALICRNEFDGYF